MYLLLIVISLSDYIYNCQDISVACYSKF